MNPPKVNFISPCWKGGAGWFVNALARGMAEAGIALTLISPEAEPIEREGHHQNLSRIKTSKGPDGKGTLAFRVTQFSRKMTDVFAGIVRARLRSRVFLYSFIDFLPVGVAHFLLIRLLGGRLVYIVHDATPHAWAFPERFRRVEQALHRLTYRLPSHLVTLTEAAKAELVSDYGIAPDRISVIPHGAYVPERMAPISGTGQVILFGTLRRNKRIKEAIEAFSSYHGRFPRLRLLIAGAVHAEDQSYWTQCSEAIIGHEHVIKTEIGFVEEGRLQKLIAESDAVLLPYEDFNSQSGVAVLACFSERILIATAAGGIGELQTMGLHLHEIQRPVSPETIADALQAFALLPIDFVGDRAVLSRQALEQRLDWTRIGQEYALLLDDHLSKRMTAR
ncbi:glycosyltransferase family 4 protein [Pannonibacter sp. I15F10I1]|uniref:glycosyltransferase family 4 protein n=1 Tax=Pannonibacter sp. I15F10I1 TaxID=2003580 RepID=UPI001645FB83|nr:glycosyltransferase family 4 protein [Pannonibacter sp. I15F10I1]